MLETPGRGDHLPEGPEPEVHTVETGGSGLDKNEEIIVRWRKEGLCRPDEILILHKKSKVQASMIGNQRSPGPCDPAGVWFF
jgi:hypothetical protein